LVSSHQKGRNFDQKGQMPDYHGVFPPLGQLEGKFFRGVIGPQAGKILCCLPRGYGGRQEISRLLGPFFPAVDDSEGLDTGGFQEFGQTGDVGLPNLAQGSLGIRLLGESLSVLDQVQLHDRKTSLP
jgi:hypothetical protein